MELIKYILNNQSYFKFGELRKYILCDELSITVQQTFRNYYYSLNFLLLIFPIQISVTYGKAKLKQAVPMRS